MVAEATRPAVAVDGNLDSCEKSRKTLHLIENAPLGEVGNEAYGITRRGPEHHGVIEAEVAVAPRLTQALRKGRLATLPRSVDQDDGTVGESLFQRGGRETGKVGVGAHCGQL